MLEFDKTILIVDDDIASIHICRQFLADSFSVLTASSGKEAVRMVRYSQIDLILLDIEMPLMDGFTTYDEIRKNLAGLQVPIIFVTGKGDKKTVLKCKSKGAEGFIVKPFNKSVLIEKINQVFQDNKARHKKREVLVIDDNVEYLKIIKLYLQDHYKVMAINTTRTAIEYLRGHEPDLILVDYYMPLYNGADILRIVKNANMAPNSKVMLVSGSMDVNILNECIQIGLDGAISKSATSEEVLERINEVLNKMPERIVERR